MAENFKGQFEPSGENTKKHRTFSIPIKNENKNSKTETYKIKSINSMKLMKRSLPSLADSLTKGLDKGKSKNFKPCLEYFIVNDGSGIRMCRLQKIYEKNFDKDLAETFENS